MNAETEAGTHYVPQPDATSSADPGATVEVETIEVETVEVAAPEVAAPEVVEEEDPTETRKPRRIPLEPNVKAVTDLYATDRLLLQEGELLTPHRIAVEIKSRRLLAGMTEKEAVVSAGAVTETLKRWQMYDFAILGQKPLHFKGYTPKAMELGLTQLKKNHRAARKAEKDAAKAAQAAVEAPAEPPAEPTVEATVEPHADLPVGTFNPAEAEAAPTEG